MSPTAVAPTQGALDRRAATAAAAHAAFTACDTSQVGLELEFHLVDLARPSHRPSWSEVTRACSPAPVLPGGSVLTVEPGGQLELSAPPAPDAPTAVSLLLADEAVLRGHCAAQGLGLLAWGADPLRPSARVHPGGRYAAMAEHFDARDCALAGRRMMASTASVQVNLDVGDGEAGARRWRALQALVPLLTAVSANSPQLGGVRSGWASMRQQAWSGIDPGRTRSVPAPGADEDPAQTWAAYALAAPVMLVSDGAGAARAVCSGATFGDWVDDHERLGRPPTAADLAYHLTTLFPPVRPRGHVEVRCLDAADARWWPGLVALASVVHDEDALDEIEAACHGLPDIEVAARDALAHPGLRDAAVTVVEVVGRSTAARGVPDGVIARSLERIAEAARQGRTPGDDVRERIDEIGAEQAVAEAVRPEQEDVDA